jgi:hypothetical protein
MLIHLGARDGKRPWYRTFAIEKYKVALGTLGIIAALLRIVLQQDLDAKCVFKHRTSFAGVVQPGPSLNFITEVINSGYYAPLAGCVVTTPGPSKRTGGPGRHTISP